MELFVPGFEGERKRSIRPAIPLPATGTRRACVHDLMPPRPLSRRPATSDSPCILLILDEATGQAYFEAKVELLEDDLLLLGDYQLVPLMPADVLAKTANLTLLGYLTSPLQRMFERSMIED